MEADVAERRAGQFAAERFDERNRAWLRRVWWVALLAALLAGLAPVGIAALADSQHMSFFWGVAFGTAITMAMCLTTSPPEHIERWRQGAEGERKTARVLLPLIKDGWVLINDVPGHRGNIDHILIGPAGVFVLETKNLHGRLSVTGDTLRQTYRDEDGRGRPVEQVGTMTRGRAAGLHDQLCDAGLRPGWLHAVVVIWGDFEQRSVRSNRTLWIHGRELVTTLASRPVTLDDGEIQTIATYLREYA